MTTTVHDVLRVIREKSTTDRELGTAFERLMVRFLSTDPVWSEQFSRVWMYGEWPGAAGNRQDLGIDLVAQERETGALWAIQCKFYEPDHTVQKTDLDSFFTASGQGRFAHRLIISTTDKWGPNAEAALDDQQIPVQRLGLSDIAASRVEWRLPASGDAERVELSLRGKKSPRPHQREAIDAVFEGFAEHDRGTADPPRPTRGSGLAWGALVAGSAPRRVGHEVRPCLRREREARAGGVLGVPDVDGGGGGGDLDAVVAVTAAAVAALEPVEFGRAHSSPRVCSMKTRDSSGVSA